MNTRLAGVRRIHIDRIHHHAYYRLQEPAIPAEFMLDGIGVERSFSLSPGDNEFVSRLYPYDDTAINEAKPNSRHPSTRPRKTAARRP